MLRGNSKVGLRRWWRQIRRIQATPRRRMKEKEENFGVGILEEEEEEISYSSRSILGWGERRIRRCFMFWTPLV